MPIFDGSSQSKKGTHLDDNNSKRPTPPVQVCQEEAPSLSNQSSPHPTEASGILLC